ncbi:response regulator transcription factor [Streptococcus rifensis]
MKILLAEDEAQLSHVFSTALRHEGYEVDQAFDGEQALSLSQDNAYDVLILDIMMPKMTGLEALREMRSNGNTTYTLMLTAMAEIDDRVNGLDAGADDYLTKPISLKELLARLRALSRRFETNYSEQLLRLGNVTLDTQEQELMGSNAIRLANKEVKLLAFLMRHVGKPLTTVQLYEHVWGMQSDSEFDDGYVWIYISYLKQKLRSVQANLDILGEENEDFTLVVRGGVE